MTNKSKILLIGSIVLLLVIVSVIVFANSLKKEEIAYLVKFNTNGGTAISSQVIKKGETVSKPTDPIKEGYTFIEWKYNNKTFDFNTKIDKDVTLTAEWLKKQENVVTLIVRFETDGGTTISTQLIEENKKIVKPADPTKEGYVFKGWKLEDIQYDFDLPVTKDITLTAIWEEVKPVVATTKYTVTFNSDGGSSVSKQTVAEGSTVKKPTNPTKSGYDFKEWQLNGKAYNFSSKVTKSITLKAVWTKKNTPTQVTKYTVTFDSNGGSSVSSQLISEGGKATQPANPIKSGYNFSGWKLNGNTFSFNTAVNSNITLVASWTQKSYTITATPVDAYSPDRILTVKEEGVTISFSAIKYNDGTTLCNGTNPTVSFSDLTGETSFKVVLTSGTTVNATLN